MLRFTAQVAGTYHIEGYFDGLESGGATATDVHVQKNGLQSLWTSSVAGYGPSSAEAFYLADVPLAEGDTVDFCVGEGTGGYLSDPTGLRVEIALTAGLAASDTPGIPAESAGRVTTWTYDAAGRRTGQGLTATGFGAEVPPGGGNGVTVPTFSIYDDSDALTGAVSVFPTGAYYTSYSYDANGSRTGQETGLAGSGVSRRTTYGWDAAGRLASVELPHAADNPSSQRHTFTYSGMGLRHEHIGPDGRDVLLWDMAAGGGSDPLLWRGTAGASSLVYERFIQEPDANAAFPHLVRAAGRNAQGVAFSLTYHTDAHGSAAYLAGLPGTGSGSATFTFDAWGERLSPVADTGAGGTPTVVPSALGGGATIDENPLLWLGGLGYWREPALAMGLPGMGGAANSGGLSYVRARWLDSLPAQWLSVDPVMGEPRYGYAGQMPTLRTDPSGTQSLGDLLKGGADWAAQQFGYRDAAAVGSDAASGVMAVGRAVGDWVQSGVSAARQAAAVVGQGVRLTLHVAAGVARTILIDPWTSVWEVVSHASMQLFARASQTWSHHVGVLRQIWNTLERLFQTTTAHWERVRRSLPPILANVLPPSPTNVREFADYQVGLLWGALQGLFGMVGAVAAIPAMVEFLQFLIGKIGQSDFWSVLWEMVKAQWDSFAGLFTHEMGMDARARGELLGSVLIGVILLVVEILTGLAATGVALEFTGAGILRALKATGKLGLEEARNAAAKLGERVSPVRVGRTHGFAHAVAGSEGLLRNRAPIDWQLTLGKLTREVGEHLHGQTIGVLKRDVETVQQLGGAFKARVRQHFNGERRSEEPLGFHESSGSGGGNGGGGGDDGGSGGGRGGDEPEDIIRRNIEGVYQKFGGRPANIEAINASLQEITDSAVVLHFHREKGISEILGGESRLKTGIEGGVLEDPNVIMRRRVEEALFGQPKKDAPGIFYGVLQDKSESYATSNAKKYGSIALTLREHIKGRSTITRRDSLKVLSANSYDPVKAMMPAVPLSKIEGAFLGDALRHNDEILSATSVKRLREIEDPLLTDLDAIINQNYIGDYFEVQIHGGLEARDIQHAEFNQGDVSNEVKEWLTRNNITFTEHTQ